MRLGIVYAHKHERLSGLFSVCQHSRANLHGASFTWVGHKVPASVTICWTGVALHDWIDDWMMGLTGSEGTKLNSHGPFAFCELLTVQDT